MIKEILFSEFVDDISTKYNVQPAVTINDESITFAEIKNQSDKIATFLIHKGIKKGDHVALWGYNSLDWITSFYAITKIGAVAVLLNYSYTFDEAKEILRFSDISYIMFGENRETKENNNAAYQLAELLNIKKDNVSDIRTFHQMPYDTDSDLLSDRYKTLNCHDDAVLIFTTGSTSFPKGVRLTSYSILNLSLNHGYWHRNDYGKVASLALPLFHCFGLTVMHDILSIGSRVILSSQIKTAVVLHDVSTYHAHAIISVPTIYLSLIEQPTFNTDIQPYVKFVIMGGGVTTPEQYNLMCESFKDAWLCNGYGASECSPYISVFPTRDIPISKNRDTVGVPFPGTEVHIQDVNTKEHLPSGKIGEVIVKGFNLMNGYYKLPASEQPIDTEGWYHTGDLGYLDKENFLILCGRIKDIIIKNGENISPLEIEKALSKLPDIAQTKCFGYPHPLTGEGIAACIILKNNCSFDQEATIVELKKHIAPFKVPSHFVIYESFPLKENGKIDAVALKDDMLVKMGK